MVDLAIDGWGIALAGSVLVLAAFLLVRSRRARPTDAPGPGRPEPPGGDRARAEPARTAAERALPERRADYLVQLAHELRTPLHAIDGFATLIARTAESDGPRAAADRREAASHIADGARHLAGLIDDILAMARAEAGQLPVSIRRVDVAREVQASLAMLAPLAAEAGVAITTQAERSVTLGTDPRRLREVVLNLVGNAIKYTPEGGRVTVEVAGTHDGATVLVVADTGHGMTAEELRTVFEPWVRSERLPPRAGSGLGLPLTKRIVEALGGVMTIRSAVGRGTVVTVHLPDRAETRLPEAV